MTDEWIGIAELAAELRVPKQTIYGWRVKGAGPRSATFGRHVRFRRSDVNAWIERQFDTQPAA